MLFLTNKDYDVNFYLNAAQITNHNCTDEELELHILFWICAAGKKGVTSAKCLGNLLSHWADKLTSPFAIIKKIDKKADLVKELQKFGIGCMTYKAGYFRSLIAKKLDLKTCSLEELESVKGIGLKTARCFLLHSRPNQQVAGLDRHMLKFLKSKGHDVPEQTPNEKIYEKLQILVLQYVKEAKMTPEDFDLMVWRKYSKAI